MTKKRVAVLGSSGQIGAYLTEYLRKKGYFVREFDIVNDPHDGVQEEEMFLFLEEKEWQGLVLLDDIGPQWPEIEDFWNRITFPKLDVSDVGHMSGTGAVSFDSKHALSWI